MKLFPPSFRAGAALLSEKIDALAQSAASILNGGTAGTVAIQAAGSAAQTSTVYRGSYCEVF